MQMTAGDVRETAQTATAIATAGTDGKIVAIVTAEGTMRTGAQNLQQGQKSAWLLQGALRETGDGVSPVSAVRKSALQSSRTAAGVCPKGGQMMREAVPECLPSAWKGVGAA